MLFPWQPLFTLISLILLAAAPSGAQAQSNDPRVRDCVVRYAQMGEKLETDQRKEGPVLRLPALADTRDYDSLKDLRVAQYNLKNLETSNAAQNAARAAGKTADEIEDAAPKPQWARSWVASQIKTAAPDIAFVDEIHGFHSLDDFARSDLGETYRPLLIRGNDPRIDIGILVKKDLPLDIEVWSNADRTHYNELEKAVTPIFHRDSPVVFVRKKGASLAERPLIIFQPQHLKSKRPLPNDPHSAHARAAEIQGLIDITDELWNKFPRVPTAIVGDMNGEWRPSKWDDFGTLRPMMKNAFDLAPNPVPDGERATQFHFGTHVDPSIPRSVPLEDVPKNMITHFPDHHQLDVSLISPAAAQKGVVKDAGILPYKGKDGSILPPPADFDSRERDFPSDHKLLYTVYDFLKLRALAGDPR